MVVGLIGLGNMGAAIAVALQGAGFRVVATAATEQTRRRAAMTGLAVVDTVASVAESSETIVLALPTPGAVTTVVEGMDGLEQRGRAGQVIIDTTTSDPATSRRLAGRLGERGIAFIDAPVSGAPEIGRRGQLTVMIGGRPQDVERADPVLRAIGSRLFHVGPSGSGNVAKLANNLMAAAHLLMASEAVELAKAAGIEPEQVLNVINASTGRSFVTEQVYPRWILNDRFDLGFAAKLMRKDVRLAASAIVRLGLDLPLSSAVALQWSDSVAHVHDDEDVTRIVELVRRRAASTGGPPTRPDEGSPGA